MVLAAGLGMRMRPLTLTRPKPLISLAGMPLIDHVLYRLAMAKVETAVVNVHYLAEQLEEHLTAWNAGGLQPATVISDERDMVLDTGGGVKRALPLLGAGPFFVHNSDSVWYEAQTNNLKHMLSVWDRTRMDALLLLAERQGSLGYSGPGDFTLAASGRVSRRVEGGTAPFVFSGVSLCDPRLFADSPDGPFSLNLLWDRALEKGRLMGLPLVGKWMHIGTPEALAAAEATAAKNDA